MNQLQKDKLRAFYIKFRWIGTGLWEFILNVFISTLPISIGVIVLMVSSKHNHSLFQAINYITARGELVIYSATLMAPILYAIQKDPLLNSDVFSISWE